MYVRPRRDDREAAVAKRGRGGRPVFKGNNSSQLNTRASLRQTKSMPLERWGDPQGPLETKSPPLPWWTVFAADNAAGLTLESGGSVYLLCLVITVSCFSPDSRRRRVSPARDGVVALERRGSG